MVGSDILYDQASNDAGEPRLGPPPMRNLLGKEVNDTIDEPQAVDNTSSMQMKQAAPENFGEVTATSKLPTLGAKR